MNMEHQEIMPVCFVNIPIAQTHVGVLPPLSTRCHDVASVTYTTTTRYIEATIPSVQ
jgi:hypothetical protein